ncbi:MAG: DMT family transporter [Candidatus Wallbacteria bacterium]|nr:DMT family transporter [Candidatus Wallbacteria bacterium]
MPAVNLAKTVLILLTGIIAVSLASIFTKYCDDVPAVVIAAYRVGTASCILILIAAIRGVGLQKISRTDLKLAVLGGFFLSLHFLTWFTSLKYTTVTTSVVLVTTNPIFVSLFSFLLFREKLVTEVLLGIIMTFAGSVILALTGGQLAFAGGHVFLGNILALCGAVMASCYLMVGSNLRERMDILAYTTIVYSSTAVFLLFYCLISGAGFTGYRPSSYVFMLLMALIPQLLGHSAFNWALRHLKASMVALTILGEPVLASIFAHFLFRDQINSIQMTGIILIFAGIIIAARKGAKK